MALPRPCTRQAALGIHLFSCFEGLSQESSAVPGVLALTVVSSGRCRLFCLHPPSSVSPTLADTLPLPPQLLCFWGGCGADQAVDFSTLLGWGGATSFQPGLPCTPLPGGMMVQRPWWGSWEVLCWSSGLTLYASLSLSLRLSPEQFKRPTRLPVCPWELPTPQHQPQPREPRRPPRQGARVGPRGRRGRGSTKVGLPSLPPLREARLPLWGWQDACPPDLGGEGLGESPRGEPQMALRIPQLAHWPPAHVGPAGPWAWAGLSCCPRR